MVISEEEYSIGFFRENGFYRRKCKICGSWFWTLNGEKETCSDTPCTEYNFFDLDLRIRGGDVRNVRKLFIEFFENRGHVYIEPKPVVARWREDLYLTIASIVVFQPFVTNGIVPPPANPLVISQPCIRLEDIDYVGKTMGRHLTSFEMAAHHAFNYPEERVYWKDETVDYAFQFFTREFGVPEELLTFKEAWWEGGGNAGPCFEVTIEGLEVATLVFMQYKTGNGGYEEIPLKIVDTGYGVERMAWLAQQTPTGFHAVYGRLVDRFHELLEVDTVDEDFLLEVSKTVSTLDVGEGVEKLYQKVAEGTGLNVSQVRDVLNKVENLYALLDHTRTIAFMLSDGIVPSNSGEGYLARLVIRRAIRALRALKSKIRLGELVTLQLKYWGGDFKRMLERADYILKVLEVEEERYNTTLSKGQGLVGRVLKKYKGSTLPIEELVILYDSHGIPPEFVRDVAKSFQVKVVVPEDFYSIIAKRHSKIVRGVEAGKVKVDVEGVPPTKLLFHQDPYLKTFKAKVLYSKDGYVVLDQTCFYPEGGGALSDTGILKVGDRRLKVVDVQKVGDIVIHRVNPPIEIPKDSVVVGEVDWDRRYSIMRHHTSTHVVLAAARRVLGEHVWQAGAEKSEEKSRLDITHYDTLSVDEVREIERLANMVVREGRIVSAKILPRLEAEEKYGFTLYQGGVPPDPKIRVVEVEGWDAQACFGVHVRNTRELGLIKIVNVEKIQDGVVRLEFVAGDKALEYTWGLEERLKRISEMLRSSPRDVEARISSLLREYQELKDRLSVLRSLWVESEVEDSQRKTVKIKDVSLVVRKYEKLSEEEVYELARRLTEKLANSIIAILNLDEEKVKLVLALSEDARNMGYNAATMLKMMGEKIKLRGGGKETIAQGLILERFEDLEREVFKVLKEIIEEC